MKRRIAPKGYVHPCRTIERRPENNENLRFLSDDERRRLLDACRLSRWPRLYMLVLLALTTGARKGELLALSWEDIDFERGLAHCGRTKNGDAKALPLVPAVVDLLRGFEGGKRVLVFPSTRSPNAPYAFEGCWRAALKEAKLRSFRFHDLRHTCASMLAQNGATLLEIGDVLGHRQLQMTKRYSHPLFREPVIVPFCHYSVQIQFGSELRGIRCVEIIGLRLKCGALIHPSAFGLRRALDRGQGEHLHSRTLEPGQSLVNVALNLTRFLQATWWRSDRRSVDPWVSRRRVYWLSGATSPSG
jgi:hypothetical protein